MNVSRGCSDWGFLTICLPVPEAVRLEPDLTFFLVEPIGLLLVVSKPRFLDFLTSSLAASQHIMN